MTKRVAKTVFGVYVLAGEEVIDSDTFDEDEAIKNVLQEDELERKYDAEPVVLPVERVAELAGKSVEEVRERQVQVARAVARERIKESGERDQLLVQAVRALEDLDEMNNDLSERLRPWFSLHFPELEEELSDNSEFAATVAQEAKRENMEEYGELAQDSTGMPIDDADARMLGIFASQLSNAYTVRDDLEQYVEVLAQEVAPNLSELLGGLLAGRIVSLAGSLEKLAKMPASTIQVLGAEKAMFRHMRGEGSAPKHGVLFMHEFVQKAGGNAKGEMARVLANKAAIAARLDQFGGDFKGEELHKEVKERFEELNA